MPALEPFGIVAIDRRIEPNFRVKYHFFGNEIRLGGCCSLIVGWKWVATRTPQLHSKEYPIGFDWRADESPIDGRIQSSGGIEDGRSLRVHDLDFRRPVALDPGSKP
jgi:hypothetical protein